MLDTGRTANELIADRATDHVIAVANLAALGAAPAVVAFSNRDGHIIHNKAAGANAYRDHDTLTAPLPGGLSRGSQFLAGPGIRFLRSLIT